MNTDLFVFKLDTKANALLSAFERHGYRNKKGITAGLSG